jgi:hypothetical protein
MGTELLRIVMDTAWSVTFAMVRFHGKAVVYLSTISHSRCLLDLQPAVYIAAGPR